MSDEILLAMQQAEMNEKGILAGLVQIIKAIAMEHPNVIPPESMGQLAQLIQQAEQIIATPEPGEQPQEGAQNGQQPAGKAPAAGVQ